MSEDLESLPGCLGFFEVPISPNTCPQCHSHELCKKISAKFIPKKLVLERLEKIQKILKEG